MPYQRLWFVKPQDNRLVPVPYYPDDPLMLVPEDGLWIKENQYWRNRRDDGDIAILEIRDPDAVSGKPKTSNKKASE